MPETKKDPRRPVAPDGSDLYSCDNCGKLWKESDLKEAQHVWNRIDDGGPFSHFECPDCGALCYVANGEPEVIVGAWPDDLAERGLKQKFAEHVRHKVAIVTDPHGTLSLVCQTCGDKKTRIVDPIELGVPDDEETEDGA